MSDRHAYLLPSTDRNAVVDAGARYTLRHPEFTYTVHDHAYLGNCVATCRLIKEGQVQKDVLTSPD